MVACCPWCRRAKQGCSFYVPMMTPAEASLACPRESRTEGPRQAYSLAEASGLQQFRLAPSEPRVTPQGLYFHFFLAGCNFLLLRKTSLNRAMNRFQGVPHVPPAPAEHHEEGNRAHWKHMAPVSFQSPQESQARRRCALGAVSDKSYRKCYLVLCLGGAARRRRKRRRS